MVESTRRQDRLPGASGIGVPLRVRVRAGRDHHRHQRDQRRRGDGQRDESAGACDAACAASAVWRQGCRIRCRRSASRCGAGLGHLFHHGGVQLRQGPLEAVRRRGGRCVHVGAEQIEFSRHGWCLSAIGCGATGASSPWYCPEPVSSSRSRARPRDIRERTVPTGMARARAISS